MFEILGTLFFWWGKWPVPCQVIGCARNRNATFFSFLAIVKWLHGLRASRRVQVCPGKKIPKLQVIQKIVMDHIRAQTAFIAIYGTLLIEDRPRYILNLRYCRVKLFVYGWLILMLISWFLEKSTKHSTIYRATCLHLACHVHRLITQCTIYCFRFFAHLLFDEIDIFSKKKLVDIIGFAWNYA